MFSWSSTYANQVKKFTIPGRVYRVKYKLSQVATPAERIELVEVNIFSPINKVNVAANYPIFSFGTDREIIFTATESITYFLMSKGSIGTNQSVYLDYVTITEIPSQVNIISCVEIQEALARMTYSGQSTTDQTLVKNYLNKTFNRNHTYSEYATVIAQCSSSTQPVNYVLAKAGAEAASVKAGYAYGFGGQMKDDEMYGDGNSYDFGARIHDPRLGRFLSLDPLSKKFPSESNYSYSGNNPILFVDTEGKKKTVYLTIINKDGKSIQLTLVDKHYVAIKTQDNGDYGYSVTSNDVTQHITIDLSNRSIVEGQEQFTMRQNGPIAAFADKAVSLAAELEEITTGNGGTQKSGFRLVSVNGENVGADPTKMKAENIRGLQTLNFDDIADIMTAAGAKGKSLVSASGKEVLGDLNNNIKEIKSAVDNEDPNSAYQRNKTAKEAKNADDNKIDSCEGCHTVGTRKQMKSEPWHTKLTEIKK